MTGALTAAIALVGASGAAAAQWACDAAGYVT